MEYEVINIKDIHLVSINQKYIPVRGRLVLSANYRHFKTLLTDLCKPIKIEPPYAVKIYLITHLDIDNVIKCILDAIEAKGVLTNDKKVYNLFVYKKEVKRNVPSSLRVVVDDSPIDFPEW